MQDEPRNTRSFAGAALELSIATATRACTNAIRMPAKDVMTENMHHELNKSCTARGLCLIMELSKACTIHELGRRVEHVISHTPRWDE